MLGWKSPAEAFQGCRKGWGAPNFTGIFSTPRRNEVIICHRGIFFQEPSWDGETVTAEFASTDQHAEIIEVFLVGCSSQDLGSEEVKDFLGTRY